MKFYTTNQQPPRATTRNSWNDRVEYQHLDGWYPLTPAAAATLRATAPPFDARRLAELAEAETLAAAGTPVYYAVGYGTDDPTALAFALEEAA